MASLASHTNRGAQPTARRAEILIDWLSYTAPDATPLSVILPNAARLEWTTIGGAHGYRTGRQAGEHIRVYSNGRDGGGVHVELSGQACRELESLGLVKSWPELLGWLVETSWHVTRLDLAIDDRGQLLDLDTISQALTDGSVTTRWKSFTSYDTRQIGKPAAEPGRSIVIGSSASASRLRIYDKTVQLGLEPSEDQATWTRLELQLRDERAAQLVSEIAASGLGAAISVLRSLIEFRQPDAADSNRSRWAVVGWWTAFCAAASRARLTTERAARTIDKARRWLQNQVAPTLAMVFTVEGGDFAFVTELVTLGRSRWRASHVQAIAAAGG